MRFKVLTLLFAVFQTFLFGQNFSEKDVKLFKDLADEAMLQVRLGEMAKIYGKAQEVKALGATMVKDHSALIVQLNSIAAKNNFSLPEILSEKSQKTIDKLAAKKGKEFDKLYCKVMTNNHTSSLQKLKNQQKKSSSDEAKELISQIIPVIEKQKELSESAKNKID